MNDVEYSVRLFARIRELVAHDVVIVRMPGEATVADLRSQLTRLFPTAAKLLAGSAIAVNNAYAFDSQSVKSTDELAVIPPVSGG